MLPSHSGLIGWLFFVLYFSCSVFWEIKRNFPEQDFKIPAKIKYFAEQDSISQNEKKASCFVRAFYFPEQKKAPCLASRAVHVVHVVNRALCLRIYHRNSNPMALVCVSLAAGREFETAHASAQLLRSLCRCMCSFEFTTRAISYGCIVVSYKASGKKAVGNEHHKTKTATKQRSNASNSCQFLMANERHGIENERRRTNKIKQNNNQPKNTQKNE